jgi:hypothetical protein
MLHIPWRRSSSVLLRDVSLGSIIGPGAGAAFSRITVPAAAWQFEDQSATGGNVLPAFRAHPGAVVQFDHAACTVLAAVATFCRMLHSVEHR